MRLIIFDIDGTLIDSTEADDDCYRRAFLDTFGYNIDHYTWEEITNVTDWGITEEIVIKELDRVPSEGEYERMKALFVENLKTMSTTNQSAFREIYGARDFLKLLQGQGYGVGIATGSWQESALVKLRSIGIDPADMPFSHCSLYKSREAIVKHNMEIAREVYDRDFDDIVYFGDGLWDYKTCNNLRIKFIGIDTHKNEKLVKAGAINVFHDYRNFDRILEVIES